MLSQYGKSPDTRGAYADPDRPKQTTKMSAGMLHASSTARHHLSYDGPSLILVINGFGSQNRHKTSKVFGNKTLNLSFSLCSFFLLSKIRFKAVMKFL